MSFEMTFEGAMGISMGIPIPMAALKKCLKYYSKFCMISQEYLDVVWYQKVSDNDLFAAVRQFTRLKIMRRQLPV